MTDKEIIEAWFRHPNTLKTEGDRFAWFAREIRRLTLEECAKHFERAAERYAMEFGYEDNGSLTFGSGYADGVRMEYYNDLLEHATSIRAIED